MTVIGVIGAGAVGQTLMCALVTSGIGVELVIASRTRGQASAVAADIEDLCLTVASPTRVRAGCVADVRSCDVVVVVARAPAWDNTRTRDVRMAGMHVNAPVIAQVGQRLEGYPGPVLVVTNPVDLMTRLLADMSGCQRVYGVGAALDSARYRAIIARHLAVPVTAVAGHVIGEHGDSAVLCVSSTTVHGQPVSIPSVPVTDVHAQLRARPALIRGGIGRVRAGGAGVVVSALRKVLALDNGMEELSFAYRGGWLGVPVHFVCGQPTVAMPDLSAAEKHEFGMSDAKLRVAYRTLNID